MKYLLLLVIFISATYPLDAQNTDALEYYVNSSKKKCNPANAMYYRIAVKDNELWRVKDFYIREQVKAFDGYFAKYEHDSFSYKQGMHYEYQRNGRVYNKVRYVNNMKEGLYKEYDTNGKLTDSILYKKDIPYKYGYKWFSNGAIKFKGIYDTLLSGKGEEWTYHSDGKLSSYGKTVTGYLKDSVWSFYHNNGSISSIETYLSDSLQKIECYNEDGSVSDKKYCTPQLMPISNVDVAQHLTANLKYPKKAKNKNVQGTVYVNFFIDIDGSVTDVTTIGPILGMGCEEEAIRVVRLMPKWIPGRDHNRLIRVYYSQPITFRLE